MGRRVQIPLLVLALLGLALAVLTIQGLRMARDRHARLLPARTTAWLAPDPATEPRFSLTDQRFLVVDLPAMAHRVGLYQTFPERTLVRWIEPNVGGAAGRLVIPLEGLQAGTYLLTAIDPETRPGPREMDLPQEQLDVIGRFRLDLR